jgi:hypothetical protein
MSAAPRSVEAAQPLGDPSPAGWRAAVHEIAWTAVRRSGGDHADLEWLPAVVEEKLAARVDILERAGATAEEFAAAYDDVTGWATELLGERSSPRKRGALTRSAWPVRLR